jgi:hypothetical protein
VSSLEIIVIHCSYSHLQKDIEQLQFTIILSTILLSFLGLLDVVAPPLARTLRRALSIEGRDHP